jgi:hypothetical protein
MDVFRMAAQYPLCVLGLHVAPPPRYPMGPVVADCPCCGRTCYFFGLSVYGLGSPPVLIPRYVQPSGQLAS